MTLPIFLDANIPIYATGRPHPLKQACADILALVAAEPHAFVTDAEVLQELLHRYLALQLWPQGRVVLRDFAALMRDRVEPVLAEDVDEAALLADGHPGLSARDLVHAAVMGRVGTDLILSADRGFDGLPQLQRLDPADLEALQRQIAAG